jgi:hypothetical protein
MTTIVQSAYDITQWSSLMKRMGSKRPEKGRSPSGYY